MRKATAVIGANYGDEGKGLVVDALCADPDTVVVRFNGGAQAGHTVVTPEGKRHVFGHHGSGTFRGAATYLSDTFILNPLLFEREHRVLGFPRVMASDLARLTTPYDMVLNQWAEIERGEQRHGSCGLGINETVERCESMEWLTTGYNTRVDVRRWLKGIAEEYVPMRAEKLGIKLTHGRQQFLNSEAVMSQYESACRFMHKTIEWRQSDEIEGDIIFEGAQGLLLDQDAPDFPYVTRSKTGLAYVQELCRQMGIAEIDAVFVTRTYLTRHGAGPMPTEDENMSYPDDTNTSNPWQHGLRFGSLDVPDLLARIHRELYTGVNPSLAVTHVDQFDNELLRTTCPYPMHESRGPTRTLFTSCK